jgi:hypothetical protein
MYRAGPATPLNSRYRRSVDSHRTCRVFAAGLRRRCILAQARHVAPYRFGPILRHSRARATVFMRQCPSFSRDAGGAVPKSFVGRDVSRRSGHATQLEVQTQCRITPHMPRLHRWLAPSLRPGSGATRRALQIWPHPPSFSREGGRRSIHAAPLPPLPRHSRARAPQACRSAGIQHQTPAARPAEMFVGSEARSGARHHARRRTHAPRRGECRRVDFAPRSRAGVSRWIPALRRGFATLTRG